MSTETSPVLLFLKWYDEHLKVSNENVPSAVCLSTIGLDNFPNARFVSFKEINNDAFIITGPLNSRKGMEIEENNHVALTFWWPETERQVRLQGIAKPISEKLTDKYFSERSIESQAVSLLSKQGAELENLEDLEKEVENLSSKGQPITRPNNWGGFQIQPVRMEFMEFRKSRLHERLLYELRNGEWSFKHIQP